MCIADRVAVLINAVYLQDVVSERSDLQSGGGSDPIAMLPVRDNDPRRGGMFRADCLGPSHAPATALSQGISRSWWYGRYLDVSFGMN